MGLSDQAPRRFGEYRLIRLIATGGMAEVYEAHRDGAHGFTRRVAVKRVLPQLAGDSRVISMFCDEARIQAALEHPNLVHVVDFGEADGELFIAMEYVAGLSCAELMGAVVARGRSVDLAPALYIGRELLRGLGYVHSAEDEHGRRIGLVHRDVAPSNVLIGRAGEVKLADFGIVRSPDIDALTQPGEMRGKLGYVSPEQAMGSPVDARSDLFSVGVLLAELLIGRPLFAGRDELEVLTRVHSSDLTNLTEYGKHVPHDVSTLLHGALSRRPEHRPQDALQFAQVIDSIASRHGLVLSSDMLSAWLADLGLISIDTDIRERPRQACAFPPRIPSSRPRLESVPSAGSRPQSDPVVLTLPGAPRPRSVGRAATPSLTRAASDLAASVGGSGSERRTTYRFRSATGEVSASLPLPDVLALIATGHVGYATEVSRDSEPFSQLGAFPELARLSRRAAYRFQEPVEQRATECWALHRAVLPRVLYRMVSSQRTGLLCARNGPRQLRIYWVRGAPVFSSSTEPAELLGFGLIEQRLVSREALEHALNDGWGASHRLGETLVSSGLVRPDSITSALVAQLGRRLASLMEWRAGALYFIDDLECGERGLPAPVSPLQLVTEAVMRAYSVEAVASLLAGIRHSQLERTPGTEGVAVALGLPLQHARALARAPHEGTLDNLVRRLGAEGVADPRTVMQAVFVGLCSGALRSPAWS